MRNDRRRWVLGAACASLLPSRAARAQAAAFVPQALPVERIAAERLADGADTPPLHRPIPSSGEMVPVVGLGTGQHYHRASPVLAETLESFARLGGRVVDTAPSHGETEAVLGGIIEAAGLRERLFLVTRVDADGRDEGRRRIENSFRRLRTQRIDLVCVHELRDVDTQLATLRALKDEGRIRYVGIATSQPSQYGAFARVLEREPVDFIQVDYALDDRGAGEHILPLAHERGAAALVRRPLGGGRGFRAVQGKTLPEWAADFGCASWAQFFLKYAVANEAVVSVLPDTARPEQARENAAAARGPIPDAVERRRMERFIDAL